MRELSHHLTPYCVKLLHCHQILYITTFWSSHCQQICLQATITTQQCRRHSLLSVRHCPFIAPPFSVWRFKWVEKARKTKETKWADLFWSDNSIDCDINIRHASDQGGTKPSQKNVASSTSWPLCSHLQPNSSLPHSKCPEFLLPCLA